ncbi:MAG: NERD domain-containing protein [Candidatus Dadabacteria bacterium]|nr:NERD domain-containing protein [Candidatus Dadabacteria bacterium]
MKITHFPCGPASNESELKAFSRIENQLRSMEGQEEWVLLTNLAFSVTHQLQSDEIDIVLIGTQGVHVIEVKHWTYRWVRDNRDIVEQEAEKVANKARKIGTTLRKVVENLQFVEGTFLLTQERSKVEQLEGENVRGVKFHTLKNWKEILSPQSSAILSGQQIETLSRLLEPKSGVALDGSLRRLAGYVNLELQSPKEECFHRVYTGIHSSRKDRAILHLYDLSAGRGKDPETKARREFDALLRLQVHTWAPRILDSYQDAPGYAGEMHFFTIANPAAPTIEKRGDDESWDIRARINFSLSAVRALKDLHEAGTDEEPMLHRNLNVGNILVKHDNSPIFTGFRLSKIPLDMSIAGDVSKTAEVDQWAAPEVNAGGIAAADRTSDVYSLCACLNMLFGKGNDNLSRQAADILEKGFREEREARADLSDIEGLLSELLGKPHPSAPPSPPPARFWTEDQMVPFGNQKYRIVSRLGSGGTGTAFKVVEIDQASGQDMGTYVGKVVHDSDTGRRVCESYRLARSHLGRQVTLSTIFEVAPEWRENGFVALMKWVEGSALGDFTGVFQLLTEDQQESSEEALALRWIRSVCEGLNTLHRNGLVHGDVSPRNMIVSGSDIVLTDYDFVTAIGKPATQGGTALYSPPSLKDRKASASEDIYSLASSFFHVMFEKEPFIHDGVLKKERGLNWKGINRAEYPVLSDFLDKATHPDPKQRFGSVSDAMNAIKPVAEKEEVREPERTDAPKKKEPPELARNRVPWLQSLLESYPGSKWGNRETRGLDSDFANRTYVATELEETLYDDIENRRVSLVVLCGNAGDGKTALLQSLSAKLGSKRQDSLNRIIQLETNDGLIVRMNLDGSAAWKEKSADELLDEFLEPFREGHPDEDIVHLLAINDGRLLEWAEREETHLTAALCELLENGGEVDQSHIRFINLNRRSLVGDISENGNRIKTDFLEDLIDKLYGGEDAAETWKPCLTCVAQQRCEVFRAAKVFGPDTLAGTEPTEIRNRARKRLFEALQSIHLRGETQVTIRELRATLVYILFGIRFCDEYHNGADEPAFPYWDRAFSPDSPRRQGELLRDMIHFDPGLDSHPKIDRHLLRTRSAENTEAAPHYQGLSRESARRRAYFEWTEQHIEDIAGESDALGLTQGRHLNHFREIPLNDPRLHQQVLCERLCKGISRLEDLPPQAFDRPGAVPLRITPRTPTETAFWVEKPLESFRLEADIQTEANGFGQLHRHAFLIYSYRDGKEEKLRLGAELFHRLLELGDGYQLGDVSTDDTFAHLSIFVQRLVREDERELYAWNPMQEEHGYEISTVAEDSGNQTLQTIRIRPVKQGESE